MGKVILFAIIGFVIYYFLKNKPKKEDNNDLILCKKCNTFYPKEEMIGEICKDCYANSK